MFGTRWSGSRAPSPKEARYGTVRQQSRRKPVRSPSPFLNHRAQNRAATDAGRSAGAFRDGDHATRRGGADDVDDHQGFRIDPLRGPTIEGKIEGNGIRVAGRFKGTSTSRAS